jgi:hypothetical protein
LERIRPAASRSFLPAEEEWAGAEVAGILLRLDITGPARSTSLSKREEQPPAAPGEGRVLDLLRPPPEEPSSEGICRLREPPEEVCRERAEEEVS